jgi:predicted acyl esterase
MFKCLLTVSALLAVAVTHVVRAGNDQAPIGVHRSTSLYVMMRDGTPIAVTVHLPSDLKSGEQVPVLMRTTRYWREYQDTTGSTYDAAMNDMILRADFLQKPDESGGT